MNTETMIDLIRQIDRLSRMRNLTQALNFEPCCERITRVRWPRLGLDPSCLPATLHLIGRRNGAGAFALVFSRDFDAAAAELATRRLQTADVSRHALVFATDRQFRRLAIISTGPDLTARSCVIQRDHPRASDAETLLDMVAPENEGTASITIRYARALDRARVTTRFFDRFRDHRAAIAAAWTGLPERARNDRDQLALLFLCRLMFLYFLQHAGHLAGDRQFLPRLVRHHRTSRTSIYRSAIVPLFFGALNRKPDRRTARARSLGELPYLNGGLFERHALERRHHELDLPDATLLSVFDDLLERYRFSTREPADSIHNGSDGGIDPEMLGRVFEGVMSAERRSATGAFYTPAHAVDQLVRDAISAWLAPRIGANNATAIVNGDTPTSACALRTAATALAQARVLDPACGSGAFLLGSLSRITAIRAAANSDAISDIRRDVVGSALHGVDLDSDAALLCALRLWLALAGTDGPVRPLPNLDRRIRQGDALLDPIDLALASSNGTHAPVAADPAIRDAIRSLQPLAAEYLDAEPDRRDRLRTAVARQERAIARAWIDALRARTLRHTRELRANAADQDLFNQPTALARAAAAAMPATLRLTHELDRLRNRLRDDRETPFFSFRVHFADAAEPGFDLVLSNPPWVRAHRWPRAVREITRRRYAEHTRGWSFGARLAGAPAAASAQTDMALLFLERAFSLLAPGGVLGFLLPAKMIRSLYAGAARARLIRDTPVLAIRDCSLDHHAIFRADAFAASIIARRPDPATPTPPRVSISLVRKDREELRFETERADLPLFTDDPASPWLLAPEPARRALRHMQKAGPPLGLHDGLRVRRGIFTGANDVLLIGHATPRISGLASIRALGYDRADSDTASAFTATIESPSLRPVIRGSDIRPWTWQTRQLVIFLHDSNGRYTPPPPRLDRYLQRHHATLDRRSGSNRGFPRGAVFRVTPHTLAPKVAWHDLAPSLEAVALPASSRSPLGDHGPLIPLNTTYFIPSPDDEHALLLAAFLNATPLRTFARTIAERAKDTRFRFFAWTIAALPLPTHWRDNAVPLIRLARQAHVDHGLAEPDRQRLDQLVARAYHLNHQHLDHLAEFDSWIGGAT